jgi:hypothetical protein
MSEYGPGNRFICTKEKPWKQEYGDWAEHPDAVVVDSSCDCCEAYQCPHCGRHFKVELPE